MNFLLGAKSTSAAGAMMGVIAAGVAVYFMEAHKIIKKAFHKCGLDVRPSDT